MIFASNKHGLMLDVLIARIRYRKQTVLLEFLREGCDKCKKASRDACVGPIICTSFLQSRLLGAKKLPRGISAVVRTQTNQAIRSGLRCTAGCDQLSERAEEEYRSKHRWRGISHYLSGPFRLALAVPLPLPLLLPVGSSSMIGFQACVFVLKFALDSNLR